MQNIIAALTVCFFISQAALSQKKYYEFNNPDALKLTKKRIEMLTSVQWHGKDLKVSIRGDETIYNNSGWVIYKPDGTYSSNRLSSGTWEIKYNRYLVHTVTEVPEKKTTVRNPLSGIYSITMLNDSTLTLTKLQSSAHDMTWSMTFSKQSEQSANSAAVIQHMQPLYGKPPSAREIDSISYLTLEDWFINNFTVFDDMLYLNTVDSLYKIKLNLKDPLRKVRIFHDNEVVSYHVFPKRYTLPVDRLHLVDSLALSWIKPQGNVQTIFRIEPYFRQYIGFEDSGGNKVILLNAFQTYRGGWREDLVHDLTSPNDFRIFVNLTKQECFGLKIKD